MTSRAEVIINTPADRERVARWARETGYGTVVLFKKKSRSTEQNAKMWAMLSEVSEQVEWYGNKLTPEDWKTMFTASLRKANVMPGIDAGTVVPLGLSTSAMTIEEMTNLIELIYAFGAERDVVFADPQEQTNTNTDDVSPASSVDADAAASASEAGDDPSPRQSPASTPIPKDMLVHFKDYARKALEIAGDQAMAANDRSEKIAVMLENYRDAVPDELWSQLSGMDVAFKAVVDGARTVERARSYIATDILECSENEIGGGA
jgi:hypothetical protein